MIPRLAWALAKFRSSPPYCFLEIEKAAASCCGALFPIQTDPSHALKANREWNQRTLRTQQSLTLM
jgi:hypothetical protein